MKILLSMIEKILYGMKLNISLNTSILPIRPFPSPKPSIKLPTIPNIIATAPKVNATGKPMPSIKSAATNIIKPAIIPPF